MKEEQHRIRVKRNDTEIEVAGSRDFVEMHLPDLLELVFSLKSIDPTEESSPSSISDKQETKSLKAFYKSANPQTQQDRVLLFVYWLEKVKKIKEPTHTEIAECYEKVSVAKPARIRDTAKELKKKSPPLLLKGKKSGTSRLSIDGQEYVETTLLTKGSKTTP